MLVLLLFVALERPYDRVDQDGDGADLIDVDGDGYASTLAFGEDCADTDPTVHPGAPDARGDGLDADCGGSDGPDRGLRARRGARGAAPRRAATAP
jgi:hypothetical protein